MHSKLDYGTTAIFLNESESFLPCACLSPLINANNHYPLLIESSWKSPISLFPYC